MVKVVDNWDVAGIGRVSVAVSNRARYTRITLTRDGTIRLTIPQRACLKRARAFLESKRPWIRRHQQDVRPTGTHPAIGRAEARRFLTHRVRELAEAHGFRYNRVFVKNQRTLWGSCSARNNINLNIHLLRLPEELRDYVIVHELTHTRHKNHGKAFWNEVSRIVGDAKALQKQLRRHKLGV